MHYFDSYDLVLDWREISRFGDVHKYNIIDKMNDKDCCSLRYIVRTKAILYS
jgi:hypothetical protein